MSKNYKHISNNNFPSVNNVNVFQRSDYDYANYTDAQQMTITLCSVPWDMGIVHVGNAQIGGVGNVVSFEGGEVERDSWFDNLEKKWVWTTNFRKFHNESEHLKIPLPYDEAIYFNYAFIDYEPVATSDHLIYGESKDEGMRRWFYFIRDMTSESPNCTSLELASDYWQQYSYNLDISYMQLERGHYAVAKSPINEYLKNPVENNGWVLAQDVNFDTGAQRVAFSLTEVINKDVLVVFALSAQPNLSWGGAYSTLPADAYSVINGVPSASYLMAIEPSDFQNFLSYLEDNDPQFKTAVKGIFLVPRKLVSKLTQRSWGSFTYWDIAPLGRSFDYALEITGGLPVNQERTKTNFGYDDKYKQITKLYTSPYAHYEITDGRGNTTIVKIEDTCGHIGAEVAINLSFPDLQITAHLIGIGNDKAVEHTFDNLSPSTIKTGGRWYDYLFNWNVPVFSITQDNARTDLCKNYYNYQAQEYTAQVARDNAKRSAATEKVNADNSANAITTNADISNAAASAITARNNEMSVTVDKTASVALNRALAIENQLVTTMSTSAEISAEQQGAMVSAATSIAQGAVGSVTSLLSLDVGGSLASMPNALMSVGSNLMQTQIGINLKETQASIAIANTQAVTNANNQFTETKVDNSTATQTDNTNTQNSANKAVANNTANVTKTNASNSKSTAESNADATYDAAINTINKAKQQAALQAPNEFGATQNTQFAHTKPICLNTNFVTQSKDAIARAGDEFLRYGYFANRNVEFDGNWNVMDKFSYWKCSDVWIKNLAQPDAPTDQLRYFLMGGVTVWRKPEYIGNTSIYENGV